MSQNLLLPACELCPVDTTVISSLLEIERSAYAHPWSTAEFQRLLEQPLVAGLLAAQDNEPTGFIIWQTHREQASLINLAVRERYQGQGLGKALVKAMLVGLPPSAANVFLLARRSNQRAIRFYKSLGFICTRTIPDYWPPNQETAVEMALFGNR